MVHRGTLGQVSLPPLPYVGHEILLLVNETEPDPRELTATLAKEPSLAARLVGTANTAYFAGREPVDTLEDAVRRLGLDRTRILLTSILLRDLFDARRTPRFDAGHYWQHALGTAAMAQRIARETDQPPGFMHLAGLLHSVGLVLLAHAFPAEMEQVFATHARAEEATSLAALEQAHLGTDHHAAGGLLLREWALPERLCALVTQFAVEPAPDDLEPALSTLQGASAWASNGFADAAPAQLHRLGLDAGTLERLAASGRRDQEDSAAISQLLAAG